MSIVILSHTLIVWFCLKYTPSLYIVSKHKTLKACENTKEFDYTPVAYIGHFWTHGDPTVQHIVHWIWGGKWQRVSEWKETFSAHSWCLESLLPFAAGRKVLYWFIDNALLYIANPSALFLHEKNLFHMHCLGSANLRSVHYFLFSSLRETNILIHWTDR